VGRSGQRRGWVQKEWVTRAGQDRGGVEKAREGWGRDGEGEEEGKFWDGRNSVG